MKRKEEKKKKEKNQIKLNASFIQIMDVYHALFLYRLHARLWICRPNQQAEMTSIQPPLWPFSSDKSLQMDAAPEIWRQSDVEIHMSKSPSSSAIHLLKQKTYSNVVI